MTPFERLQADSPYRAIFRNRDIDPGELVVTSINWWSKRVEIRADSLIYWADIDELFLWRKPDPSDPMEKLREFLEPDDIKLKTPLELVTHLYQRVKLAADIKSVADGTSWDYCKVTTIDWLNKTRRWIPIHRDAYWHQIGCVPPFFQHADMTMVGEAYTGPFHLTVYERLHDRQYWCCLLTKSQVKDPTFIANIPFAWDMEVLGVPEKVEA